MSERVRCSVCGNEYEARQLEGRRVEAEDYYFDHASRRHQGSQTVAPQVLSETPDEPEVSA